MKVVIVEDEQAAARRLTRLLGECNQDSEVVATLDSVAAAETWFQTCEPPDLILMDIELVDGSAFDIFERIEINVPIIFCTAYDKYAIQAFKVNSIDYLLKPIEVSDLRSALEKHRRLGNHERDFSTRLVELMRMIREAEPTKKERFLVKRGRKLLSLPISDVAFFHTKHKIVRLVTLEGKSHPLDYSLEDLEAMVPTADFFRANRQTLVSFWAIGSVESDLGRLRACLVSPSQPTVLISRERSRAFREWLDR